jgi:hypothetical protein
LHGLRAYRTNAAATAERALAESFPTIRLLLGEADFRQMARQFWCAQPPARGDLGEWGAALADWIAEHAQLNAWPYLPDTARLDWLLHRAGRATDDALDTGSLVRLGEFEPAQLLVHFLPGVALLESRWPLALMHHAHHADTDLLVALREAIAAGRGESVVVSRVGWKACVTAVDRVEASFTGMLLDGMDLGSALGHAGERFDLAAWLERALRGNWVKGVVRFRD